MSRVIYDPPSGARDSVALNAILDDIAAALGNVSSANLAEEGIDQTVLPAESHAERRALVVREDRTVVAPQSWDVLTMDDGTVRTGAIGDLADGSALRIRTLVSCSSAPSGGNGFDNSAGIYEFRHVYNDGSDHVVTASLHARAGVAEVAGFIRNAHGDLMRESWLVGPISDIAYIELQFQNLIAGDMRVQRAHLVVDEFKRVEVT